MDIQTMLLFGWLDPGFNDRSVVVRQRRAALKRQKAKDVIHEKLSDAKEDLKRIKSNGYTHELQKCTGVCTSARDPRHDAETDSYTSNTKRCSGKSVATGDQKCLEDTQSNCETVSAHKGHEPGKDHLRQCTKASGRPLRFRTHIRVFVSIFVLGVLTGAAVILALKLKNGNSRDSAQSSKNNISSYYAPGLWLIEGTLDLRQDFKPDLYDPTSELYRNTSSAFIAEMDRIMSTSPYSFAYAGTELLGFSPGSIKCQFRMRNKDTNVKPLPEPDQYTAQVARHIRDVSKTSRLPIDESTITLQAILSPFTKERSIHTTKSFFRTSDLPSTTAKLLTNDNDKRETTETTPLTKTDNSLISMITQPNIKQTETTYSSSIQAETFSDHHAVLSDITTDMRQTQHAGRYKVTQPNLIADNPNASEAGNNITDEKTNRSNVSSNTTDAPSENKQSMRSQSTVKDQLFSDISNTNDSVPTSPTSFFGTKDSFQNMTINNDLISPDKSKSAYTDSILKTNTTVDNDLVSESSRTEFVPVPERHENMNGKIAVHGDVSETHDTSDIYEEIIASANEAIQTATTMAPIKTTKNTTLNHVEIQTSVKDQPPIANAGKDIDAKESDGPVTLDGSKSSDDHAIVSYHWSLVAPEGVQLDILGLRTSVATVTKLAPGMYTFGLTVTDTAGQKSIDYVTVTVEKESTIATTMADTCLPVSVRTCASRGFTHTVFPNLLGQLNEAEAESYFTSASRSIANQLCQEYALTYLCSLYFPKCDLETGSQSFPCRSLCQEAVATCGDYFHNPINCDYFMDMDCVGMTTTTLAPITTTQSPRCEKTTHWQCRDIGFEMTQFPNHFNEPDQSSAMQSFAYFESIIESRCHRDSLFFICSIQFPKCADGIQYKPCRKLCQDVTATCTDIAMFFNCNNFQEINCIAPQKSNLLSGRMHNKVCTPHEFACQKVNKCIPSGKVCNVVNDCSDWSDEMQCVCNQYQFKCDMGMCIKSYQRCDGKLDCPDNSDEKDCMNVRAILDHDGCTHGQVACPSGKCIMSEWMCDGRSECEDGWDEFNCDVCPRNKFMCKDENRTCIPLDRKCNGHPDCPDGFDEFECISDENGMLQLPIRKTTLPICASSWDETKGDVTCELLGHGPYIDKTDVFSNMHTLIDLSPDGGMTSVLGPIRITHSCPENKGLRVNCQPKGCGKRMVYLNRFIVNGENAEPGTWPWQAALYFGNQYFCGGTLINREFVLTAAHCVDRYTGEFSLLTVKLGANNREHSETTQRVIKVEAIKPHSDHVYFERNDIALLQLESPVEYTTYIQPICLPEATEPLPLYSTCFTVGWGKVKWNGDYADVLQQLKMTLWDTNKCNSSIAWNGDIFETFMCAGYYSGIRSICKSDSGGPLLCLDGQKTWKLRGINSYVANYCNMTERPNVFTNVAMYLDWINDRTECKFRCDNGKCLYNKDFICDRVNNCGDNSDETRICNRTVTCDFDDKFLCGYQYKGWDVGFDNRRSSSTEIEGQLHTQSNVPQFDNTFGRYPGHFFYGKLKTVTEAELLSPKFTVYGQTCVRFAFYMRGKLYPPIGLAVHLQEFFNRTDYSTTLKRWPDAITLLYERDEWRTGYFDITYEESREFREFRLKFTSGELLKTAVDDVQIRPGMCKNVLCNSDREFWCRGIGREEDKCIPKQARCNLVVDCNSQQDELQCTKQDSYLCTFENGNLCGLRQEVGDGTDWWLVNATFVQEELDNKGFRDHTSGSNEGRMFFISAYGIQSSSHIFMRQVFRLNNVQHCFSFYYQMKADINFNIYVDCAGCVRRSHVAQVTFEENWTLFQISLKEGDVVNVTYDVVGNVRDSTNIVRPFIALDDISVKPGECPTYVCPANYAKCRTTDRCIPTSAICDRRVDCLDEYDEERCVCTPNEFRCRSGRCVPKVYMCDRVPHCLDGSDEGDVCILLGLQSVSCTFDHPYMCGYEFVDFTAYKWRRHAGPTPSKLKTGPQNDHTFRNQTGYYMYPEANEGSKGDNASIVSPVFNTGFRQSLEFYYHIYSTSPVDTAAGIMKVWLEDPSTRKEVLNWTSDPLELHDAWLRQCINVPDFRSLRLWVTALRTESTIFGVDMAVDDIRLNNYRCEEHSTAASKIVTTLPPTTKRSGCTAEQFQCKKDLSCIPKSWVCDRMTDCRDKSDEQDCP
ncbi:uncharacterized protein LOC127857034 [Dreissena polymorpha]|uniref:uncharacterized protein LOC127857034 n=1 Tax=Dreissena polymorpha TaxID=45954 RepID=UPI0022642F69|nr:uncharacterized protein LOC127857034 [Dreissena polymorpha]